MKYTQKVAERVRRLGSALCIGLDPRPGAEDIRKTEEWLKSVVEETEPYAAAYKPNIAYFEAMGPEGIEMLHRILEWMPSGPAVILDVKRGDIGETQRYYAKAYFEQMRVDAVTLNPFMGYDTLSPFLNSDGKAVYLLCVTSNGGAADIERQRLEDGRKVYQLVGDMTVRARRESAATEVGLVVGLTNADARVFAALPDVPLLIPGLGAQGGELGSFFAADRHSPVLINVSRGILYCDLELTYRQKAEKYARHIRMALGL